MQTLERAPAGAEAVEAPKGTDYNYDHFRTRHLLADAQGTLEARGIRPGEPAPDFELPMVGGGTLRLSDYLDRPFLLHFGSYT